jgi:predicted regulator of Ras-like GTPase activity (Roadblock/LC7/MglB family)
MFIFLLELNTKLMEEKAERLSRIVNDFLNNVENVGGIYVASLDGLLVTHASKMDIDPDRVAAMIASISAVGDRVSKELLNEESTHVIVQSHNGYVIIKKDGDLVFGVLVHGIDDSSMGLVMLEFEKLLSAIKDIK